MCESRTEKSYAYINYRRTFVDSGVSLFHSPSMITQQPDEIMRAK